jgi:hypothetical protein
MAFDPHFQIIGMADIQRAVISAGENINEKVNWVDMAR